MIFWWLEMDISLLCLLLLTYMYKIAYTQCISHYIKYFNNFRKKKAATMAKTNILTNYEI